MKKFISCCLIMLMLFSSVSISSAHIIDEIDTEDRLDKYIDFYDELGDNVLIDKQSETYAVITSQYIYDEIITESRIEIEALSNGDIEVTAYEGELIDVMLFKPDGRMLVNGSEMLVETVVETTSISDIPLDLSSGENNILPLGQRSVTWQTTPPYGIMADYSTQLSTMVTNFTLQRNLAQMTQALLVSALANARVPGEAPTDEFLKNEILIPDINTSINQWKSQFPNTTYMSMRSYQMIHSTQGQIINGQHVFRYYFGYYAAKDCPISAFLKSSTSSYCIIETD